LLVADELPQVDPKSIILVDSRRLFCASHGEHLRAQWPKGAAIVMPRLVRAVLESDALIRAVDPAWNGTDGTAEFSPEKVNEITSRRPFCYFVDRNTIRQVLIAAGVLKKVRCEVCKKRRLGGPYQITYLSGYKTHTVCLECALDAGEREHEARPDGFPMERR
jgi:hypothetical protein